LTREKVATNKNTSAPFYSSSTLLFCACYYHHEFFLFAFVVFRRFCPFAVPMDEKLEKELVMEFREKT